MIHHCPVSILLWILSKAWAWFPDSLNFLVLWSLLLPRMPPGCSFLATIPKDTNFSSFPHLSVPERLTPRLLLLFYQTLIKLCLSSLLSPFLNPFMDEKQRTQERSPSYPVTPEVECCPTCGSAQSRPSSNTPTPNCPITDVNEDEAKNQKVLHRMIVSVRVSPAVWDPLDTGTACCDSSVHTRKLPSEIARFASLWHLSSRWQQSPFFPTKPT